MENVDLQGNADPEKLQAALQSSGVEGYLPRMPEKEQTQIGRNGARLSGGEKQKLAVARALLKDAPVVILDEATASCIYTQKGNKKIRKPQAANQTALIFDRRAAARLLSINSIRRLCWS